MRVWLPAIKGGSGTDIFTRRLANALQRYAILAEVTWFPTYFQFAPFMLSGVAPPAGTNLIHSLSWSGFAFKRRDTPLVVTEQLDVLDPNYGSYKSFSQDIFHKFFVRNFMKKSFAAASAVTAVSRATATSLVQTAGVVSTRVIYNSVNTETFRPRNITDRPHHPFRLLYVGNLTRRKGTDLLDPIMRRLGNSFELRFTTGLRDAKIRDASANMISIGMLTSDRELLAAYQACDALLFPSRLEGLPIAPLEAMACGKPVIAARTSSLPEVIEDRVTGILCEPDNVNAFVRACRELADSPGLLQNYGEAARERVEKLFSEEIVIPQYISLYENLGK